MNMEKREVPLCRPSIKQGEIDAVVETLESGWLAHGEYNHKLEEAFAELLGVPHAISMNSCTSALDIALKVHGIKGEVVLPSFTFVATANVVVTNGATPVFCEVDEATRNATAGTIAEKITPQTEAVIVVHYGGQPCQMDDIVTLCQDHGLLLIEDSAETIGATWRGKKAGSFGLGCFSFYPTKNITTSEGGVLTCFDDEVDQKARALISHGIFGTTFAREKAERPWFRAAEMAGHNFRMPNPLAALGYHQLLRLDEMNAQRVALAARYDELLAEFAPLISPPVTAEGATHVYQMYTVMVNDGSRDAIVNSMRERGVGASVHFDPPVHMQPFYRINYEVDGPMAVTEKLARHLITLPIYPDMSREDQDWVVECLRNALKEVNPA
jgi:perosamine synthetase